MTNTKKPIWKKWWVWFVIIVVVSNVLINQLSEEDEESPSPRNNINEGNISTH